MFVCPVPVVKTRSSVPKDCQNWERKEDDDLGFCGSLWLKEYKDNRTPFIFKFESLIIRIFRDQPGVLCGSLWVKNIIKIWFLWNLEFETLVIHIFGPTHILVLKYQLILLGYTNVWLTPLIIKLGFLAFYHPLPVPYQISCNPCISSTTWFLISPIYQ